MSCSESFSLLKNDKLVWKLCSSFTDDLFSGMILALITISRDYVVKIQKSSKILNLNLRDKDSINKELDSYIIALDKSPSDFYLYNPDPNNYGLWVLQENTLYNLYQFKTPEFMQGFISICNNFSTDFRDYIYSVPFKYIFDSNTLIKYDIEGYD